MVYLDYSATTPVSEVVLNHFVDFSKKYFGNPNSIHQKGIEANEAIDLATNQILKILGIQAEVIYTSGASESNNLAIKGIASKYKENGNHIISTKLEHSSVFGALNYLQQNGFEIDFVDVLEDGRINLEHLKTLITDETILVTIASVNSEIGIIQPIEEIGTIISKYPNCYYHVDMTQSFGKIKHDLRNIDLISFSAHKLYGIKGIGALIMKEGIKIEPQIHGGKSTTIYRSGTPATGLILSLAKTIELAFMDLEEKYEYVLGLNNFLVNKLKEIDNVVINSNEYCLPHILNISVLGLLSVEMVMAFSMQGIYLSSQTACASDKEMSKSVFEMTNDVDRATSALRISLSHLTTYDEILSFYKALNVINSK